MQVPNRKLPAKDVLIDPADGLSKAPPETDIKTGDRVRVALDADHFEDQQKWQYGRVYFCHSRLLLHIQPVLLHMILASKKLSERGI